MNSVRIPSDIDQEDRLVGGLTARQLLLIAIPTVALWALYMATSSFIPLVAFAPVAVITAGVVGTLVVTKRDGLSMDRFALAAVRHGRSPHELMTLPENASVPVPGIAPLGLPVVGVHDNGVVDLGAYGSAVICEANATNLLLQSETEQEAITGAFGRFCNSLETPMQFLIRTEPVDLKGSIAELRHDASTLASIGLERAALDHARFLDSLSSRHDVLSRVVLVVFRDNTNAPGAGTALIRRTSDAATALRAAGIELRQLDAFEASSAIQRASAPGGPSQPLQNDHEIITGAIR